MTLRVDRVGHVGVRVPDLDRSVAFAGEGDALGCDHLAFETYPPPVECIEAGTPFVSRERKAAV